MWPILNRSMLRFWAVNNRPAGSDSLPRDAASGARAGLTWVDLIGLGLCALLLLSPLVFKYRLTDSIIVHPFALVLAAAWCWVGWVSRRTFSSITRGWYVPEWQAWNVPVVLLGLSVAGLAASLAANSLWLGSLQKTGWLLLAKWVLYMAPLPLAALLTLRHPGQVIKLVSYVVPPVAFGTVLYSAFRFWQAMDGRYSNVYVDGASTFFAMGTFAEAWSSDGLSVRADTMSHTAYGMYLAFVLMFSLCLALFSGWTGLVNRRYAVAQACVLGPLAISGILLSGSRTSLLLLVSSLLVLLVLLFLNPGHLLTGRRRASFVGMFVLVPLTAVLLHSSFDLALPTINRFGETLASPLEIQQTASGTIASGVRDDGEIRQSVKNVQTRVWIWGQTIRFLLHHPSAVLSGVGYDRRRFVETVIGLPYEGPNVNFQTAHNLFLDILVKGGVGPLIPLVAACAWLFWTAVKSVLIPPRGPESSARIGIGWMLMSFWPALLLASMTGEELLTDNLLLHWTMLFGLLLGLGALALSLWLPNRILHMTASAGIGGGPAYITAVARHQQRAGRQVRIFCSDERPFVDIWRRMGVDVSVLPMRRPNLRSVWRLLKELLRAPAPIHAHGRGAAFFAVWVKLLVRVPVLYTPHGPHYAHKRGWRYGAAWLFELWFRLVFDAVLYVSRGEQALARVHHLPVTRSRVVLSGLVEEMNGQPCIASRETLLKEWKIPADRFVIGWVGRFDHAKGLDLLLNSIAAAAARLPNAVWVVVGDGNREGIDAWQNREGAREFAGKVLFLGSRVDAWQLIRGFDLYISTSRWEGLPLVLLEAMEQGVPVVASDVVGNRDILEGWGMLFTPHDAGAAADAQIRLATDAQLRARLAEAGRTVRRARFSLSRMLADLDGIYREVLGSRISETNTIQGQASSTRFQPVTTFSAELPLPG